MRAATTSGSSPSAQKTAAAVAIGSSVEPGTMASRRSRGSLSTSRLSAGAKGRKTKLSGAGGVGAGERRLEHTSHPERLPPDRDRPVRIDVEVPRHLAAEHDLVAAWRGDEAAAPHAGRRAPPVALESRQVDPEDERREREGEGG